MSYCDDPRCSMGTHHHTVVRKEIGRDGVSYSDHIHRGDSEECGECKPAPMASEPKKPCTCWVEGCPDHATAPVSAPEAPSGFECEHTYVNSCCRRCGHTAPEAPKCKCRGGHACDLCDCACHSAQDAHAVGEVDWAAADRSMAFAADRLPNGFVSVGANEGRAYLALKAENERLKALLPPTAGRGAGGPFVGQGDWSVFAGKVVEERDAARAALAASQARVRELEEEVARLKKGKGNK